jgi:hypothetical protein
LREGIVLPEAIGRLIAAVRRRWLALDGLGAVGRAAGASAVALALAVVLDRWLSLDGGPLLVVAAITILSVLAAVALSVRAMRWPNEQKLARLVEERCPELEDRLATAVALSSAGGLAPLVVEDAAARAGQVDPARVVTSAAVRLAAWRAVAAVALLAAAVFLAWSSIERVWLTAWLRVFPGALQVVGEPGDARVRAGQPLTIRARLSGAPASLARQAPALVIADGEAARSLPMIAAPANGGAGGHAIEVGTVDRTFTYHVTAAGIRSRDYTITAVRPPRVTRIDLRYQYPAFTGLAPRTEVDGGDVYAPAGTRVQLNVRTDRPVASAALTLGDSRRVDLKPSSSTSELEGVIVIDRDDAYRVALADTEGLANPGETEYFIRMMDDRPPDVRVLRPGGDRQATPLEEVLVEARAEDDYRIGRFELVFAVRGAGEKVVSLGRGGAPVETGRHLLFLEDLGVKPGDFVSYYARVRDVGRGAQGRDARSEMFFVEVTPFDQEFSRAQSQAGAGAAGAGAGLEALIAAQKDIINATWNLDRRARAGRSEQDVRAVGKAQAELRGRTESIAARLRFATRMGAGRRRPGTTAEPEQPEDPIGKAVEAMKLAEGSLEKLSTSEAMPHEMAALHELLRAEAEIRRRQVMQQMAGGGGGGAAGRSGQDLSALFDRELQRQQQTNYENRESGEQRREDEPESDALAKVRELARRQDELSRRQRELANAKLNEEELRRQLERLTREQTELREQAERLDQELSRSRQNQDQNQNQSGAQQGRSLRDASDEMRGATSDLRRQDLAGASARGDRAAERLRELERQMRGRNPNQRRRELGELQVEAQQLADLERRVADEASRLGRGTPDPTTRTRLADEQDRLAGRVEGLDKQLREMASSGQGDEKQAATDAARELARRNVGRGLKESAEALRSDAKQGQAPDRRGAEPGQAERDLARSLDRVAERMGAQGDADGRRLADEMARAREARDRLSDMARRLERLEQEERGARNGQQQSSGQQQGRQGQQQGGQQQSGQQQSGQQQGGGGRSGDLARLRDEYQREIERAREVLQGLERSAPNSGMGGATPEQHEYSISAPGREAFKNDFSNWERLRKDVSLALEQREAAIAEKLAGKRRQARLAAGAADGVPESYRALVAKYFESLARSGRAPAAPKQP